MEFEIKKTKCYELEVNVVILSPNSFFVLLTNPAKSCRLQ